MFEKKRVVEEVRERLIYRRQCAHIHPNGRRCRNRCWAGKKLCFQHDPEAAELREKVGAAGALNSPLRLKSVAEIQAALARALADLQEGRIKPAEAYAAGYLAQLALSTLQAAEKLGKLDVKHFWEMVDLGAAVERAVKMAEERRAEKEEKEKKEASLAAQGGTRDKQEAGSFAGAQDEEAKEVEEAPEADDLSG